MTEISHWPMPRPGAREHYMHSRSLVPIEFCRPPPLFEGELAEDLILMREWAVPIVFRYLIVILT